MRWLILGALLAMLLLIPQALAFAVTVTTGLVSQPVLVAFALGLATRPHLPRRWSR
ncbi:hypothetical protein [Streptomyces antibioticus]|uniref:hypothetical protein n=1 Tax=Streptomyces antibioticus TaxID=1890 RepID=UPI003D72BC1C